YFCSPDHRDSALFPFAAQLGRAAGFERDDEPEARRGKLRMLLKSAGASDTDSENCLAEFLGIPNGGHPSEPSDLLRSRELTLRALLSHIETQARQQPVLMVFEDAHWADASSLELLDRAIARLPRQRVLLVMTLRPEFQAPWIGHAAVTLLSLARL